MPNVLLLREPTPSADGPDRYEAAFASAGYTPLSVPVLESVHTNLAELRDLISRGPVEAGLGGVVVTSKRSCEAWREGLRFLRDASLENESETRVGVAQWCDVPFYVVGHTTASALLAIFAEFDLPVPDIRGQESGSAAALAPFILHDLNLDPNPNLNLNLGDVNLREEHQTGEGPQANPRRTLLYLTGDKNRDTLPKLLKEGGIELRELQVYKTQGSSSFEVDLEAAISRASSTSLPSSDPTAWWIVYFAPSAAAHVTPILHKYFLLPSLPSSFSSSPPLSPSSSSSLPPPSTPSSHLIPPSPTSTSPGSSSTAPTSTLTSLSSNPKPKPKAKIASIGPTTHSFLATELGLEVHAQAGKPTAEDVVRVVRVYDGKGEGGISGVDVDVSR